MEMKFEVPKGVLHGECLKASHGKLSCEQKDEAKAWAKLAQEKFLNREFTETAHTKDKWVFKITDKEAYESLLTERGVKNG